MSLDAHLSCRIMYVVHILIIVSLFLENNGIRLRKWMRATPTRLRMRWTLPDPLVDSGRRDPSIMPIPRSSPISCAVMTWFYSLFDCKLWSGNGNWRRITFQMSMDQADELRGPKFFEWSTLYRPLWEREKATTSLESNGRPMVAPRPLPLAVVFSYDNSRKDTKNTTTTLQCEWTFRDTCGSGNNFFHFAIPFTN